MKEKLRLSLSESDRSQLRRLSRSLTAPARSVRRAKIILCRADGISKSATAVRLGVSEVTVQTWTDRFRSDGIPGLDDRKGRGRKPSISAAVRERIVTEATRPPKGCTRHSTTTLFAALDYATGRILHDHHQTHTHAEWLSFLRKIDRSVPKGVGIHIVLDNYATHKHDVVAEWLKKHPRITLHFLNHSRPCCGDGEYGRFEIAGDLRSLCDLRALCAFDRRGKHSIALRPRLADEI